MKSGLRLHESILLLALRDEKGTIERKAGMYSYALGGAILTELCTAERIRIGSDKKKLVEVTDESPMLDDVLDEALLKVSGARRRKSAARWVPTFANMKRLRHRIADNLCDRGILKKEDDRVLVLFRRKVYPTRDSRPERELVERMHRAIFGGEREIDDETAVVITLADSTGLLKAHFDKRELKMRRDRLERIAAGDMTGGAAAEAVKAAQQAAVTAAIAASTAAAVASTAGS